MTRALQPAVLPIVCSSPAQKRFTRWMWGTGRLPGSAYDPRVKVVERTNIKNAAPDAIYAENDVLPDFCAMDLSFISITKVLGNIRKLMQPENIEIMALIKPQFEAGREFVGKNGVVRELSTHIEVTARLLILRGKIPVYLCKNYHIRL